jgi:hypothetical protein
LSGRQSNNPQQKPAPEHEDESIKNQTVGALGALAMFAAVIVIGSCSSSKPVAVQQTVQPTAPVSTPAVMTPPTAPAPAPVLAKATTTKHRAPTLSYVNREYGLSFTFPRNYQLKTQLKTVAANQTMAALATTGSTRMNFVHPGGVPLAAVELPANSYPGTDFKSGFVNVSANPGMTSEACAQFAFPEESTTADGSSQARPLELKISQVKLGAVAFHEVENPGIATTKQADAKYYHVFSHGACFEFAAGIVTDGDGNIDEIKPVDRKEVFARLEKILATVKFQPAVMPETQTQTPAVSSGPPEDTSMHTSTQTPTQTREQNPDPNQEKSSPVPNL